MWVVDEDIAWLHAALPAANCIVSFDITRYPKLSKLKLVPKAHGLSLWTHSTITEREGGCNGRIPAPSVDRKGVFRVRVFISIKFWRGKVDEMASSVRALQRVGRRFGHGRVLCQRVDVALAIPLHCTGICCRMEFEVETSLLMNKGTIEAPGETGRKAPLMLETLPYDILVHICGYLAPEDGSNLQRLWQPTQIIGGEEEVGGDDHYRSI